jgi:alanyl-tRNA synthetase
MILVTGFERFKGGLRVEFVCGSRALRSFHDLDDAVTGSVRLLSVLPGELPSAIEKLQASARAQQKAQEGLYERLAVHEASSLASAGVKVGEVTFVAASVPSWDANGMKKLAAAVVTRPATVAVLLGSGPPFQIIVSRSQDLPLDTGAVLRKLIEQFGGKGGGKGPIAQGGGLTGEPQAILDAAREATSAATAAPPTR